MTLRREDCDNCPADEMSPHAETIFAPASGAGIAAIALIRISGPESDRVVERLTDRPLPPERYACLRDLRDETGALIDQAIVLRFAAGASYTGEPAAELHCHGGRAVVSAILELLGRQPGCRLAEPGEFTRRAFEAGRVDLVEVEALGDLLAAETELQRRQAAVGLDGAIHRTAMSWRNDLLRAAALVEVTIDWADEDVPEDVGPEVAALLSRVREGVARELSLSAGAEKLREGFEVAILGAPNAGKSSLFNTLAGREAAITSPEAGTTRDILELRYDLNGLPVVFLDTAGLRDAGETIERLGVARALQRARDAELRLFLRSIDAPAPDEERELFREGDLRVWTKADLAASQEDIQISVTADIGLSGLLGEITRELSGRVPMGGLVGHLRQRRELEESASALDRATIGLDGGHAELISEDLRDALRALERLIGKAGVEDVLDGVFRSFCLGK